MQGHDRFGSSLLDEINEKSGFISDRSDYINELFLYFIVPFYEGLHQLGSLNDMVLKRKLGSWVKLSRGLQSVFRLFVYMVVCFLYIVALPFYVFFRFRFNSTVSVCKQVCVIRSPAAYSKIAFLEEEGVAFFFDTLVFENNKTSLYSATFLERLCGVFIIPVLGIRDFVQVFFSSIKHLGFLGSVEAVGYYKKRIAHKVVFEYYFRRLLFRIKPDVLYTGNKEDRFALVEKRICEKLKVKVFCIPHGLEYSFKMPGGLVGDVFYCNSLYAKEYLSCLYGSGETKFVFDEHVVAKMLSKGIPLEDVKKVVFFPESREPEKNLAIIKFLKEKGVRFSVKLHAKDDMNNYTPYVDESMLLDSFDMAVSNSICLARKSTILIEAIYNNSIPVAVLVDAKDKEYFEFMFPSLNDSGIHKVYSFDEMEGLFKKLRENYVSR